MPAPGGAKIKVLKHRPSCVSRGSSGPASPVTLRATRMDREDSSRRVTIFPSFLAAVPHRPIRWPPRRVTNPCRTLSSAVWAEHWVAFSTACRSSSSPTSGPPVSASPPGSSTVMGKPRRSRNSSARSSLSLPRASRLERRGAGSASAACSQGFLSSISFTAFVPQSYEGTSQNIPAKKGQGHSFSLKRKGAEKKLSTRNFVSRSRNESIYIYKKSAWSNAPGGSEVLFRFLFLSRKRNQQH